MHLHRSIATANDAAYPPETAQTSPIIATTEAKAKIVAAGGLGSAKDGPIDEGCRVGRPQPQPRRFRPLLVPKSCPEAQGRHRVGLSIPTDGLVDRRTAWRAGEAQGAGSRGSRVLFFAYVAHLDLLLYM